MDEREWLTNRFEEHRARLRAVAYRMLGSLSEADDAVQETWLRLNRADTSEVENLGAWLTTVVGRVCLNMLRARRTRREDSLDLRMPDPLISRADGYDPEQEVLLADSVGLALLVVLDTLTPAERLAFVLHDSFGLPFEEIGQMIDRSPAAARQLASRARRRVRGEIPAPERDLTRQRQVVDAFFAAAREGDFDALVAVLDPDIVLRAEGGTAGQRVVIHGAHAVAAQARNYTRLAPYVRPALVNGAAGAIAIANGRLVSVMGFTVAGGRIVAMDVLSNPARLAELDLTGWGDVTEGAGGAHGPHLAGPFE